MREKALILAASTVLVWPAAVRADDVDDYVAAAMKRHHVPGMAVAVVRGGKSDLERYYGRANLEADTAVTKDSVFRIASVSKQFSTAAALRLVEAGKLRLDDPASKYLAGLPKGWQAITVRHLLTATSGLPDLANDPTLRGALKGKSAAEAIAAVAAKPLRFAPGEKWAYCNTGFVLLSEIVAKVSGKPYQQFIRDEFFTPLKMAGARKGSSRSLIAHRACGYDWSSGEWLNAPDDFPPVDGAGELACPLPDLIKWDIAFTAGRAVKPETVKLIQTAVTLNDGKPATFRAPSPRLAGEVSYGMGCFIGEYKGRRIAWAPGAGFGFSTSLTRFPDDGASVIVLCNVNDFLLADELARGIADRVLGAKGGARK